MLKYIFLSKFLAFSLLGLIALPSMAPNLAQAQTSPTPKALDREQRVYTPLSFQRAGETITLQVEVADTDESRAKGLMYRTKMALNEGMLFDFAQTRPVYMWMQNTYISLDMLFLSEEGKIHHIVKSTTPLSRSLIGSGGPVRYVLELKAGAVQEYDLKIGDQLEHQLFTSK